jgi:hypothetical protein
MLTPERFDELMLDFLFDLLDENDAQAMRDYLAQHPEARNRLDRARELLAQAARQTFPEVSFRPPASPLAPTPDVLTTSLRPKRGRYLTWLVAASLVLTVGILARPLLRSGSAYWDARRSYQAAKARFETVDRDFHSLVAPQQIEEGQIASRAEELHKEFQDLVERKRQQLQNLEEELTQQQIILEVSGPQAIQPGAPNHFQVATLGRARRNPVAARLHIRLLGENDTVLYEEKDVSSQGVYTLHLPPDLPIKPNVKVALDITASGKGEIRGELTERLTWAAPRYVTHLATDKPLYQPGQTIHFRSLTLNRSNLRPAEEDLHLIFTLTSPSGVEIFRLEGTSQVVRLNNDPVATKLLGPDGKPVRGVGVGEVTLPEEAEGGEYVLTVSEAQSRFPPEKRKILVNRYVADRLEKELDYHRSTYGPGDEVVVQCKVRRAGDTGPVQGISISSAMALIDEHAIPAVPLGPIDAAGKVRLRFQIPDRLERGRGSLTVTFTDGGSVESIQKPIPILLKKVFVDFFPESGELVAGVPNRVYFQARTSLDRPAQIRGRLLNSKGVEVAQVETLHDDKEPGANQGLGVFRFAPEAGEKYELKVDSPTGIDATIPLLSDRIQIRTDAVAMSIPNGVTGSGQPLQIELHSTRRARKLLVGAYCRGVLLDHQRVQVEPGKPAVVELKLPEHVGGVVRVTAFEEQGENGRRSFLIPRAERLAYHRSNARVHFTVQPDRKRYSPGDKVQVSITATNEKGEPVRAIGLVSVVDQTIVTMADEKTARSMPTHFALVGEVRKPEDLEYADFLFTDHPKAAVALDLLLGVQGWRRFAEQSPDQFRRQEGAEAERILVLSGQAGQRVFNSVEDRRQRIEREFETKFAAIFEEMAQIDQKKEEWAAKQDANRETVAAIQGRLEHERAQLANALSRLESQQGEFIRVAIQGTIVLTVILACVLGITWVIGIVRGVGTPRWRPVLASATGLLAMLLVSVMSFGLSTDLMSGRTGPDQKMVALQAPGAAARAEAARVFDAPAQGGEPEGAARPKVMMARPDASPPAAIPAAEAKDRMAMEQRERLAAAPFVARQDVIVGWPKIIEQGGRPFAPKAAAADVKSRKAPTATVGSGTTGRRAPKGVYPGARRADREAPARFGGAGIAAPPGRIAQPKQEMAIAPGAPMIPEIRPDQIVDENLIPNPPPPPFVVREYSHARPAQAMAGTRTDFTETLYWNPVALFDDNGTAKASFQLSDSITTFRVLVAAHTLDGRLGQTVHLIESRKPFAVETRLPVEMTSTDRLDLPIQLRNDTDGQRTASLSLQTEGFRLGGVATNQVEYADRILLTPNQAVRRLLSLQPSITEGLGVVRLRGSSEPFAADSVDRQIRIVPDGFPVIENVSGTFSGGEAVKTIHHDFDLPADLVPGSLRLHARVFPSPVADLQQALDGMLREPYGCFEQSSSGNYPNTLITSYFSEKGLIDSPIWDRAQQLLSRGYERLISFECLKPGNQGREGYEWFGGEAPPHEALTAYGLLQFHDMAKVYPVDAEMLQRTRRYLLSRRLPEGGFQRNPKALDQFGRAPQHITDAYILWALSGTGDEDFSKDFDKLLGGSVGQNDPYFLSLLANALANRGQTDRAVELLRRVVQMQAADGRVDGAETSITRSGGRDLRIETTALALLGWLKVQRPDEFQAPINKAIRWILEQRGGYGSFGSTQATILALKALLEFTKANTRMSSDGEIRLFAQGRLVGQVRFLADRVEPVSLEVEASHEGIRPGKNSLRMELHAKSNLPFTLAWTYYRRRPASSEKCQVRLATKLNRTEVEEGDGVRLNVTLTNTTDSGLPMTVAVVGLPAGLKVPEDMRQLRELARLRRGQGDQFLPGEISYFEIRGRDLVLYWRDLPPKAVIPLTIDLRADHPGEFRGPASRAYLYYSADDKHWVEPLSIRIKPKAE